MGVVVGPQPLARDVSLFSNIPNLAILALLYFHYTNSSDLNQVVDLFAQLPILLSKHNILHTVICE